jgi:hypothetical protein
MLEAAVEDRVAMSKFRRLEQTIRSFVKLDDYQNYVIKTDSEFNSLYARFKPLVSHM